MPLLTGKRSISISMSFRANLGASAFRFAQSTDDSDVPSSPVTPRAFSSNRGPLGQALAVSPGRPVWGEGREAASAARERAKSEHVDLQNYSRNTCEYSRGLIRMVGPLGIPMLQRVVKEVEAPSNERCPRVYRRSEPLMVKWLWNRREYIRSRQPVDANGEIEGPFEELDDLYDEA
jgi:hypothetical protein